MAIDKQYDVIILGASGFTGQYVVEEAFRQSLKCNFTLAVAGRSKEKVMAALKNSADYTSQCDMEKIPILFADVFDDDSLSNLAKQAKVILNCVGPYRFYGEQVVKACVENGTHHFDISGEPQYLENMQLKYHSAAQSKGCYVVGACGFDSIPAEMGIKFITELFDYSVNDVEAYIMNKSDSSMKINFGTWESAIYGFAHRGELGALRRQLFPERIPRGKIPAIKRSCMFFSKDFNKWCLPFPGSDKAVAIRSQSHFYFEEKQRPIQFNPYLTMSSLFSAVCTVLLGGIFALMASTKFGRYLLLKFPGVFSLGYVSRSGATRKAIENSRMELMLIGRGWTDKSLIDNQKPNRKIIGSITGPECGYVSCSIFIVQAAVTVLKESDKMPSTGGVYAPLAAFNKTSYFNRIQSNGINFNKITDASI